MNKILVLKKENEIVIISIDNGTVKMVSNELLNFPANHLDTFKQRLRDNDLNFINTKKVTK